MQLRDLHHTKVRISGHARARMAEFGISKYDLRRMLEHPEVEYQGDPRYPERRLRQSGEFGVVIQPCHGLVEVITVLRRLNDHWEHE